MAKSAGTKRVRFAENRSAPKRVPLPWLHCTDKACSMVPRYKPQKNHQDKYHGGKYSSAVHCKAVNCEFCIYRKSPAPHHLSDPKNNALTQTSPIP